MYNLFLSLKKYQLQLLSLYLIVEFIVTISDSHALFGQTFRDYEYYHRYDLMFASIKLKVLMRGDTNVCSLLHP